MNFINSVKAFKLVTDESKNAWSIQAVMLLLRRLHDQVKCFVTTDHQREPLPAGAGGGGGGGCRKESIFPCSPKISLVFPCSLRVFCRFL